VGDTIGYTSLFVSLAARRPIVKQGLALAKFFTAPVPGPEDRSIGCEVGQGPSLVWEATQPLHGRRFKDSQTCRVVGVIILHVELRFVI
jgi:hypothetical protein